MSNAESTTGLRSWRSAWVLMLAAMLCSVDRTLPAVLTDAIRGDMGLSDTQISLLVGFAFAACYGIASFPMSWLADRYSRPLVITLGIVVWCCATLACGFAPGFVSLFVLRMGVGLGESALVPAGVALLADLFARERLPRAVALVMTGSVLGLALAFPLGSGLHALFESLAAHHPLLGNIAPWRPTFVVVGALGLLLAIFTARLPEPKRNATGNITAIDPDAEGLVPYLRRSAGFTVPLVLGLMLFNLYTNGTMVWLAPYFMRVHGWTLSSTGPIVGVVVLVAGVGGSLAGGWLASVLSRRLGRDSVMRLTASAAVATAPLATLAPLMSNATLSLALIALQMLLTFATTTVLSTSLLNVAPPHLRARFVAINMFAGGLLGAGLGPTIYAVLTDRVFGDAARIGDSISLGSTLLFACMLPCFVIAARRYQHTLERVLLPAVRKTGD